MLLTGGIARCGRCGAPLRARPSTAGTRRYGCPPEGNHGYGCGGVARVAEPVDDYVTEAIVRRLELSDLGQLLDTDDIDIAELHAEIEAVDAKLAELAAGVVADALTRPEWDAAPRRTHRPPRSGQRRLDVARRDSAAARIAGTRPRRGCGRNSISTATRHRP